MSEHTTLKSKYSIGDKKLHDMPYDELLLAVETIWNSKNAEISKVTAERDAYLTMLKSPLPIHSLWVRVADNAFLLWAFTIAAYLFGKALA